MPYKINKPTFSLTVALILIVSVLLAGCSQASNPSEPDLVLPEQESVRIQRNGETPPRETIDQANEAAPEPVEAVESADEPITSETGQRTDDMGRETRALWSRVGVNTHPISRKDVDALVAQVDGAHLNVILFAVYTHGMAFFEPSHTRFSDQDERLENQSTFEGDEYPDALSYLLAIRNERRADDNPFNDFEVHAWFNVHRGGDMADGWPPVDKTEPMMLNAIFPEFKQKYGAYYLENDERFIRHERSVVHQPKFRAYMTDLIAGLVEDYQVDGVHLDHIRTGGICFNDEPLDYPGTAYDYPGCQADYKDWTLETYGSEYTLWQDTDGHNEIQDGGSGRVAAWLERAMSFLVEEIHDEVKAVEPDTIISVASVSNPVTPEARKISNDGQVTWDWLDKEWIDAIFVTAYSEDTQDVVGKIQAVKGVVQIERNREMVFPGIATYTIGNRDDQWSYLLVQHINALMYEQSTDRPLEPGVKGIALFRAAGFGEAGIKALADGPFAEPALPFWGEPGPDTEALNLSESKP